MGVRPRMESTIKVVFRMPFWDSWGHFWSLGVSFWVLWGVILGALGGHFGSLGGSLGDFGGVWETKKAIYPPGPLGLR